MSDTSTRHSLAAPVAALIPAYRAAPSVFDVVHATARHVRQVIVVDDGSKDDTARRAAEAGATVLPHARNLGKGAALKSGFAYCRAQGYRLVVTLDADGQHEPAFIPELLDCQRRTAAPLVIGSRRLAGDMPPLRRFGNRFSSFWLKLVSGYRHLGDSQSGFRVYDLQAIPPDVLLSPGTGFEYEYQVILALARRNLPIATAEISTVYGRYPDVASNFRAGKDTARIIATYLAHALAKRRGGRKT
ncbi:MAG: glycosyltransferase family 2 protein [Candidatus Schekmanbacteria bacterium]|nr:glycosyltransferase family 2 protein [Candidatus Schekmanbacteria bacterium]